MADPTGYATAGGAGEAVSKHPTNNRFHSFIDES
jgi:hypothetical protein